MNWGYGRRAKIIPEAVEKFGADLLVMGAHGHRGLKRFLCSVKRSMQFGHKISIPLLAVK
jgi:manganese transport protein